MRKTIVYILFAVGVILLLLPVIATVFALDLTPGFGVIQMIPFLLGLTSLTIAGFLYISILRQDLQRSLQADIGLRLGATGLVLAYTAGLADLLGIGTHTETNPALIETVTIRPVAGYLQQVGLIAAALIIIFGMVLYFSSKGDGKESFFQFLAPEEQEKA